jgi:hypothetical protein
MTSEAPRLPKRAEALLADAPLPELDWEAQARAIDAKLANVTIGSTDAKLLQTPELGAEPSEPTSPPKASVSPDLLRPVTNPPAPPSSTALSDLARSVAQRSAREESSALIKQSLSVAAAARAQIPPIARAHATNAPPVQTPTEAVPRAVEAPRSMLSAFLAGAGVAIAAAAAVAFVMRAPAPAPVAVATVVNRPAEVVPAPGPTQKSVEAPVVATTPEETPAPTLPRAEGTSNRSPVAVTSAPPSKRAEAPAPAAPRTPSASKPGPAAERVVLEESSPPASAPESALRPASGSSNTMPARPSGGAVQAALGSVLGAARACVAGASGASSATITFASSGKVTQVNVTGPAAGTPAGRCIQSALSRAHVAPFTQPTYVIGGISIRP